jgi:hypothetical protein
MPQVIVKATLEQFYYALATNAGRRQDIRNGCSPAADIVSQVSSEFQRRNPSTTEHSGQRMPRNAQHEAKIDNFYRKVCHVRLAKEGNDPVGGFVVMDGELVGLHNIRNGSGDWMLREAVNLGADRLDCFDVPHLIDLYQRHGFREILREPNHTKGKPDIVWMRRNA